MGEAQGGRLEIFVPLCHFRRKHVVWRGSVGSAGVRREQERLEVAREESRQPVPIQVVGVEIEPGSGSFVEKSCKERPRATSRSEIARSKSSSSGSWLY